MLPSYKENSLTWEWLQEMFHCRKSHSKKDSYQYDLNSCMMLMSTLPTWYKRNLNANIHDDTWVSHQHNNKGISEKTWRIMTTSTSHRWFRITSSRNHEIGKKTRSHIKHQTGICVAQCILEQKEVHEHTAYTSHPGAIWRKGCQTIVVGLTINLTALNRMEMTASTWKLTPVLHFGKWPKNDEEMETLSTPSDLWHRIVQNRLSNFWILRKWEYRA